MKITHLVLLFTLVLSLSLTSSARAVDEGQTKPRASIGTVTAPNSTVDIIPSTSGAGNVKGFQCSWNPTVVANRLRLHFIVDGGTAQIIDLYLFPVQADVNGDRMTSFVPTNVRFDSSIQVRLERLAGGSSQIPASCVVSWGLD